jgi:hypothetical protein
LDGIEKSKRAKVYIGLEMASNWLHRDFILGYFGDKVSVAQLAI